MSRANGTRIPTPREHEDDPFDGISPEDEDTLNIYLAQIHAASRNIASPDEIEDRLEAAKVAVSKRRTVEAHRAKVSDDPLPETRRRGVLSPPFPQVLLGGSLLALFASDYSRALTAIGGGVVCILMGLLTAPRTQVRLRRKSRCRRGQEDHNRLWWHRELDQIALEAPARKPGPYVRAFDVCFALVALLVTAPVSLATCLMLSAVEGRTILRGERRVGAGAQVFVLLRFHVRRSRTGLPTTVLDWGLSRTGIEQIPRLWNLLRGDLTLVGPKPEIPAIAVRYPRSSRWVFSYRPGLTGPVSADSLQWSREGVVDVASYLANVVPAQAQVDCSYLRMPRPPRAVLLVRAVMSLMCPPLVADLFITAGHDRITAPRLVRWGIDPLVGRLPSRRGDLKPADPSGVQGVVRWSEHEGVLV